MIFYDCYLLILLLLLLLQISNGISSSNIINDDDANHDPHHNDNNDSNDSSSNTQQCCIYRAPNKDGVMSLYSGNANGILMIDEFMIPIYDANKNEYSSWHDNVWDRIKYKNLILNNNDNNNYYISHDLLWDNNAPHNNRQDIFISGIGSILSCSEDDDDDDNDEDEDNMVYTEIEQLLSPYHRQFSISPLNEDKDKDNNIISIGQELKFDCKKSFVLSSSAFLKYNTNGTEYIKNKKMKKQSQHKEQEQRQ